MVSGLLGHIVTVGPWGLFRAPKNIFFTEIQILYRWSKFLVDLDILITTVFSFFKIGPKMTEL